MEIEIVNSNNGYYVRFKYKGSWKYVHGKIENVTKNYINCIKCNCRENMSMIQAIFGANPSCSITYSNYKRDDYTIEEAVTIKQLLEDLYNQHLKTGTVVLKTKIDEL